MKALAATLVAAALITAACSSESDGSSPEPTTPGTSSESTSSDPTPTAPATSGDPADVDPDGDGFAADDGVLALTTTARGASCFDGAIADYGWFNAQWEAHVDLDAVRFRLTGNTGVKTVGSPTTVPPVNFGGRIDYGGMVDWADQSPLATDRFVYWPDRDDADFLSPIEGQTGLLLFHLRFPQATVDGDQDASLGDLVAEYTQADGTAGTVTLPIDQDYRFDDSGC